MTKSILTLLLVFLLYQVQAQDDLLSLLDDETEESGPVEAIFKGSRLIHGHSVKLKRKGELEFLISHRFGRVNEGAYAMFGLDDAQMRLGFDYGISDRINIGIGRSSFDKTYDGFIKANLLRQTSGSPYIPVSIVAFAGMNIKTSPQAKFNPDISTGDRLGYTYALLIARKFSPDFSFQLMPTVIHKNRVTAPDINTHYALGTGFRYKITGSVSINFEYYSRLNAPEDLEIYNSVALGFDIETGGHVFQLHLSNSRGMMERSFVAETTGDLGNGDIHFGFNISRTFQVSNPGR